MDQLVLPLHPNRMLSPRLLEIRIYYPRESKSTNCPSNEPRPIIENSKFLVFLWLLIQRGRNPCFLLSRMHIQIRNHSLTRVGRDMLYGKYPIEIVCECCSARLQVVLPGSLFALPRLALARLPASDLPVHSTTIHYSDGDAAESP